MDSLAHKLLKVSRGYTYSYYVSEPKDSKPTLLLQHGFPDSASLWDAVVPKLSQYRLVVPDLLGYAGTSKPTDPTAYNLAGLTGDLVEILDAEGISKVISVGHDWGSFVAQRLYNFHPDRVEGLILLNVGYSVPSGSQPNLEKANALSQELFGYPALSYQQFFLDDEEAPVLLKKHLDRFYQAIHGAPDGWLKEIWCTPGGLRAWLLDEKREVELLGYAQDPALRREFTERFQHDGFEAPLCYYKNAYSEAQYQTIKALEKDRFVVRVPVLYISCRQDPVCRPELIVPAKQGGFLPDLQEVSIDSRHWSPLEKPEEIAESILWFLGKRFDS